MLRRSAGGGDDEGGFRRAPVTELSAAIDPFFRFRIANQPY
jgi:hypothetical protein